MTAKKHRKNENVMVRDLLGMNSKKYSQKKIHEFIAHLCNLLPTTIIIEAFKNQKKTQNNYIFSSLFRYMQKNGNEKKIIISISIGHKRK